MKSERLQVSVAMCTYNGSRYLEEQLRSIFEQTLPPDEIVLLDDCSSDDTVALAEKLLSRSGIEYRILVNEKNSGVKYSFQKCISACEKDIIFTADQDDIWKPEKIDHMLAEFRRDPECVFVFSNGELTDSRGMSLGNDVWTNLNLRRAGLCDHVSPETYLRMLMYTWAVPGTMMAFRKSLADKAFPIPQKKGWIHDSWLAVCAPAFGHVVSLDESLTLYRQHEKNTVGVKVKKRSKKEENITQVQKVLFYLKRHAERLSMVTESLGEKMPADYRRHLEYYISLCRKLQHYETDGAAKKVFFLIGRFFDGKLSAFDIRRKDVLSYLFRLPHRAQPPRS